MGMLYLDENGKQQMPTMGCYGIGVDRTLASIIEEHNDADGIVWPLSVAPFQAVVVPIKYEGAMREAADRIYTELAASGSRSCSTTARNGRRQIQGHGPDRRAVRVVGR
jgi:prolyl-tRNA synthetase